MKRYVLGFLFNASRTRVGLIWKRRPQWQAGKLNGIGGKVEDGESFIGAMHREFCEETGATGIAWQFRARMIGEWGVCLVFAGFDSAALAAIGTKTDEVVSIVDVSAVAGLPIVPSVAFLIPLCAAPDPPLPFTMTWR